MCYDEGTLQAYLDSELDEITAKNVEEHLKTCDVCREKLEQLKSINEFTSKALKASNIDLNEAWATLNEKLSKNNNKGGMFAMFTKYKKSIAAALIVAFIAASAFFTPLKNAEAKLLNLLRLNKMQVITITPEDMTQIQNQFYNAGIKNINLKDYGEIIKDGSREGHQISPDELDKVESELGYKIKLPADENFEIKHAYISKNEGLEFILKVDKINELIKTFGGTHLFPKELDRKPIIINFGRAIDMNLQKKGSKKDTVALDIVKTPEIVVPEGVDVDKVIDALLNLPFLPENVKKQIAGVTDWKETFPVPLSTSDNTEIKEITIRGNKGILFVEKSGPHFVALGWSENGVMYNLTLWPNPAGDKQDFVAKEEAINTLIQIANSMR
ncbi:DUF2275 domain-containing protein [Thermoanaerobacter sp. RKWS2]|uniref:DUF2275 domain-containing protein n=1 Tax=Thermoanaerobacter sp. RKWS2 TaxID=2983842 RepID=UPI00224B1154|nr:DUF2275 domain-containing protein [Thermoanaerobacter sp. RKWS2]UZQ82658.1 DUF2275 domain-containing protein [Thermoanaerobacter sp. RKWS2]